MRPQSTRRTCPGYTALAGIPYAVGAHDTTDFRNETIARCRRCDKAWYNDPGRKRRGTGRARIVAAPLTAPELAPADEDAGAHEYVPMKELAELWAASLRIASKGVAPNLMFIGPSGCGKTDGARFLAASTGLPFTKVDAGSMTDPEAWFGTRELVNGETVYNPSDFVKALANPGVILLDEISRVRDEHRNILLPILDKTRQVTNPLTGDLVTRHPQCFIIMAGNVGISFTGTSAIDPAFWSRAVVVEFEYLTIENEVRVVQQATGLPFEKAYVLGRFAVESRDKARMDDSFSPISTRALIEMGNLAANGLDMDLAVKFVVLNASSAEGGLSSVRGDLEKIWNGVRTVRPPIQPRSPVRPAPAAATGWSCPVHRSYKTVPAGVSTRTGKAYPAFRACPERNCTETEGRSTLATTAAGGTGASQVQCPSCQAYNPAGRNTFCVHCGASL